MNICAIYSLDIMQYEEIHVEGHAAWPFLQYFQRKWQGVTALVKSFAHFML